MTATPDIHLDLLDRIEIASPCPVRWEEMEGDDRTRHCSQCSLKVHNLSAMSREEAEALIASATSGERICARLYRRADGTVLTADCPVGLAAIARRARDRAFRFAAAVFALGLVAVVTSLRATYNRSEYGSFHHTLEGTNGIRTLKNWVTSRQRVIQLPQPAPQGFILGEICPPGVSFDAGPEAPDSTDLNPADSGIVP